MKAYFLSIDNGGTNTKVVIFDQEGKQISASSFPTLSIEKQADFREIDLVALWDSICQAIKEALATAELSGADIKAIGCVGHGKGLYMLDQQQEVFTHGILSTDERGVFLADRLEQNVSDIWSMSHQHIVASQSPILLRWLKENRPEIYQQIGSVLSAKDFVRFKLTNQLGQEIGDASGNNLINLRHKTYDQRLLDFFGIPEAKAFLPPLRQYDEIAGNITEEVATRTGLVCGTPVVGGLFDIDACAIASGVVEDSMINMIAGTWSINSYPSKNLAKESSGLMNSLYPGNQYLVESSSATSAGNLNKMIDLLMKEERENAEGIGKSIYDILEGFLAYTNASYNKVIFFPFLYGSNSQSNAQASFIGLNDTTTKSELIRAVYEGIAFAHKTHFDLLIKERLTLPDVIRLSGGAVNSKEWTQMFADVLGIPVETATVTEQGALGGAMAAAIGSGVYESLEEAIAEMVHVSSAVQPRLEMTKLYQRKYQTYQGLLEALTDAWDDLFSMRKEMETADELSRNI